MKDEIKDLNIIKTKYKKLKNTTNKNGLFAKNILTTGSTNKL